jgi:adenylate cyclase
MFGKRVLWKNIWAKKEEKLQEKVENCIMRSLINLTLRNIL